MTSNFRPEPTGDAGGSAELLDRQDPLNAVKLEEAMAEDPSSSLSVYNSVTQDFLGGMSRLSGARIAANVLQIVATNVVLELAKDEEYKNVLQVSPAADLLQLNASELDAFQYVSKTSYLVYATTLLDAFLSDTTIFLHLLYPSSMGRQQPVLLDDVLAANSRDELITTLAARKARETSYKAFKDRVGYLERTFGLKLVLDADTWQQIEHFIGIRNVVVHSQTAHEMSFDSQHSVVVTRTSCPIHPRPIDGDTFRRANRAYLSLAVELFRVVTTQVLKAASEDVQATIDIFVHLIKSTYLYNISKYSDDADEIEKARVEIEATTSLNPECTRARELARAEFTRLLGESSSGAV